MAIVTAAIRQARLPALVLAAGVIGRSLLVASAGQSCCK
ncbi:hypothetical protein EHW99_2486 [Erwinia amylovora]